jgi:hypothetical protein
MDEFIINDLVSVAYVTINGWRFKVWRRGRIIYAQTHCQYRRKLSITFARVDGGWYYERARVRSFPGVRLPERLDEAAGRLS